MFRQYHHYVVGAAVLEHEANSQIKTEIIAGGQS